MIRYFVSYSHGGAGFFGFGWADIVRDKPISGPEDLRDITAGIVVSGNTGKVTILNWRRFEDPPEQTGSRR